jgi:hypothetical protein
VFYSHTLFIYDGIDVSKLDCKTAVPKPLVFSKSILFPIANTPPEPHLNNLGCPKHPFPRGGGFPVSTIENIRVIVMIFTIYYGSPNFRPCFMVPLNS